MGAGQGDGERGHKLLLSEKKEETSPDSGDSKGIMWTTLYLRIWQPRWNGPHFWKTRFAEIHIKRNKQPYIDPYLFKKFNQ